MVDSTTKILTAQAEYWHAGHLAEQLIMAAETLRPFLENGIPEEGISATKFRNWKLANGLMKIVKMFVKGFKEDRPHFGKQDPVLAAVNRDFEALCAECAGRKMVFLYQRMEGKLLECVKVLQNWTISLDFHVEAVTRHPAFEWIELAATLSDVDVSVEGIDGRLARLRKVVGMLDSVVAMAPVMTYTIVRPENAAPSDGVRRPETVADRLGHGSRRGILIATLRHVFDPTGSIWSFYISQTTANSAAWLLASCNWATERNARSPRITRREGCHLSN